jgi:hypothetical protein
VAGHRGFLLREAISLLLTFSGFLGRVGSVLILSFVWNMGGRVEFGAGSIINDTYPHFEWLSHSFVLECGHVGGEPGLGRSLCSSFSWVVGVSASHLFDLPSGDVVPK